MTKSHTPTPLLLRWSEHVPVSDVQDPLGLSLRGSARLASRLLYCITSITPRARYFSFIPWCVLDWQNKERGQTFSFGLSEAIALREKALTLGCIAHHRGKPCVGGALVGSDSVAKWFGQATRDVDLRKLPFAKNPALDAYFFSLVNLGLFDTNEQGSIPDDSEEQEAQTFDDIELSPLGVQLAKAYEKQLGHLESVAQVSAANRRCTVSSLAKWGERGGLCELAQPESPDLHVLRDVFFARIPLKGESHAVRNRSLVLILELARQLGADGWALDDAAFASVAYFGETVSDDEDRLEIRLPRSLVDVATRWRMFYFHHYMSVALEGMFAWLVAHVSDKGIAGVSIRNLAESLHSPAVSRVLVDLLKVKVAKSFGTASPADLFRQFVAGFGSLDATTSKAFDIAVRPTIPLSEHHLEDLIRDKAFTRSPAGLAVPMVLLSVTLARFAQWERTDYGNWLASTSIDPYVDLVPPVLIAGLNRRFGAWWACNWTDLSEFVLAKYIVQQHQSMSYEKTAKGERCLLNIDGSTLTTRPNEVYEKIGMSNGRLRSAVRILKDLGLLSEMSDNLTLVSKVGAKWLREEMANLEPA